MKTLYSNTIRNKKVMAFDALQDVIDFPSLRADDAIDIAERMQGNGGGAMFDAVLASGVTPNGFDIVQCVGVPELALVLRVGEVANAKQFGAVGDGVANDTGAIQATCDAGVPVFVPSGTYRCEASISFYGDLCGEGESTLFKFYSAVRIPQLMAKQVPGNVSGFAIDGDNVSDCDIGLWLEADYDPSREVCRDITVTNLKNTIGTCLGIARTRDSAALSVRGSFFTERCRVFNVSGLAVGKGIMYSFGNASRANVTIRDCNVQDVFPVADSDAIHILTRDHNSTIDDYQAVIENCYTASSAPMKRGYKVQWHNAKVSNNICIGDNITIGYDTYAAGSVFDSNSYTEEAGGLEAYNCFDALDTTISNATIIMNSSVSQAMRFGGASSVKLSNITIDYNGIAAGDTLGIITLGDDTSLLINNLTLIATNQEGCGILQSGDSVVKMSNSTIMGPKFGHRGNFSNKNCDIADSTITGTEFGTQIFGMNGFIYNISNSFIGASSVALYNQSSGNQALTIINNSTVETESNAILGSNNDSVTNTKITNTSTQSGVGVATKTGGMVKDCTITNFATGIQYTNSTNTVISGNTTIDCAAQFNKTGTTDFVFYENNDR